MKNLSLPKRFTLNLADFKGLNDGEMSIKVRDCFSIILDHPTSIEDIEIELQELGALKFPVQLRVFYFGHAFTFSEPLYVSANVRLIKPTNHLIEQSWENRRSVAMISSVGFAPTTQVIVLTALPKANELTEGDGALSF